MHEKMLMLLVFLYIMASFCTKNFILRLTSRLITIKIGPSFLALFQWPVVHWVAPCAHHLRAVACVMGYVPLPVCIPHERRARSAYCPLPTASGPLPSCWPLPLAVTSMPQENETGATNGTDGTIYFGRGWSVAIGFFATDENAGMRLPRRGIGMSVWGSFVLVEFVLKIGRRRLRRLRMTLTRPCRPLTHS
jgi:hypothetical protein